MNFPPIIDGVWWTYCIGNNTNAHVPIEDIDHFELKHKSGCNGLQVTAVIKKELIDKWNSSYNKIITKGKYELHQQSFTIRNKDMPKFRKELYDELMKTPTITTTHGINAGTPIAQSWTINKKELKVKQ
jgi:hypothetical protein